MPSRFPGELHLFNHEYTGIGTNLDKRLDENDEPYEWSKPVNPIDNISRFHDMSYRDYGEINGRRNLAGEHAADRMMVKELDAIPYSSLTPSEKIQKFLVRNGINIKEKLGFGNEPVSEQDAHELHHRIVRNFPRRKVIVHNIDEIWSADLVEMSNDKSYHYILTVIDIFSKYAWAIPLKNKQSMTVIDAFKSIITQSKRSPTKLWCDYGSEFINKQFKKYLSDNNIE